MPDLHVVCMLPGGYNRGGLRHEGHAVHKLESLTAAQLREMHDDPHLALIVGGETLSEERVTAAEAAAADAPAKAEAAKKADTVKKAGG